MKEDKSIINIFSTMILSKMFNIDKARKVLMEIINKEEDDTIDELANLLNVDKESVKNAVEKLRGEIKKLKENIY